MQQFKPNVNSYENQFQNTQTTNLFIATQSDASLRKQSFSAVET